MPNEVLQIESSNIQLAPDVQTPLTPEQQMEAALGPSVYQPMPEFYKDDSQQVAPVVEQVEQTEVTPVVETQQTQTNPQEALIAALEERLLAKIESRFAPAQVEQPRAEVIQEEATLNRFITDNQFASEQMRQANLDPTNAKDVTFATALLVQQANNAKTAHSLKAELAAIRQELQGLQRETVVTPRIASIAETYKKVGAEARLNEKQLQILAPSFAALVKQGVPALEAAKQVTSMFIQSVKPTPTQSVQQTRNGLALLNNSGNAGASTKQNLSLIEQLRKMEG